MRRSGALLAAAVAFAVTAGCAPTSTLPQLVPAEEVPADVVALAEATWQRFLAAVPARHGCLPDLGLETSRELPDRGRYDPDRGVVTLRIPHTTPRLERTLVHEFAHHLEFACPDHAELRPRFLVAEGYPAGTAWLAEPDGHAAAHGGSGARAWAAIPSERWAETVVELVLGPGASNPFVPIDPDALDVVRTWAREPT